MKDTEDNSTIKNYQKPFKNLYIFSVLPSASQQALILAAALRPTDEAMLRVSARPGVNDSAGCICEKVEIISGQSVMWYDVFCVQLL